MSLTATIGTTIDEVLALVDELEEIPYGGMDLRQHALACAALAVSNGADDTLVAATLLHDVGRARYLARGAPGIAHEEVSRRFVRPRFGERAGWLVAQHVVAHRYLAAVDDGYTAGVPKASKRSLRRQGGRLPARQVTAFARHEWCEDAVALRRWDDAALDGNAPHVDHDTLAARLDAAWVG